MRPRGFARCEGNVSVTKKAYGARMKAAILAAMLVLGCRSGSAVRPQPSATGAAPTASATVAAAPDASALPRASNADASQESDPACLANGARADYTDLLREKPFVYQSMAATVSVCDRAKPPSCKSLRPGFVHPKSDGSPFGYSQGIVGDVSPDGSLVFLLHASPKVTADIRTQVAGETYRVDTGERVVSFDVSSLFGSDPISNVWSVKWIGRSVQLHNELGSGPVDHGTKLYDPLTGAARAPAYFEVSLSAPSPPKAGSGQVLLAYPAVRAGWDGYDAKGNVPASSNLPVRVPLPSDGGAPVAARFAEGGNVLVLTEPFSVLEVDVQKRSVAKRKACLAPPTSSR